VTGGADTLVQLFTAQAELSRDPSDLSAWHEVAVGLAAAGGADGDPVSRRRRRAGASTAAGRFDGFFEFGLKPWDIAAGALLVKESGGTMTRVDGEPLDLSIGDVLASCPGIESRLKAETSRFLAEIGWTPRPKSYFGGEKL